MTLFKALQNLAIAALLAMAAALPGLADDANMRVIVPDAPGGAIFAGCYHVQQRLYGPYRMTFCLKQRGTYEVKGGGVTCNGKLSWSVSGRDITIKLKRTACGNGVAWSPDTMVCRGAGLLGGLIPFVIVPDVPNLAALKCTYTPSEKGYVPVTIIARRFS